VLQCELETVIAPRLFVLEQLCWAAAQDDIGDVCPAPAAEGRMDFFHGIAYVLEDCRKIMEQSRLLEKDEEQSGARQ
jgi:hypothetical protein